MLISYLRSASRHLIRHPFYSFVNLIGLALGLACALAIGSFVRTELAYDRHHEESDRIVRIATTFPGGTSAATPRPLASALETHLPAVEIATRISRERADRVVVSTDDLSFVEADLLFADRDVFEVFTIPLRRGRPDAALAEPFSIVLTETATKKYFHGEDPIGKRLQIRLQGDRDVFEYTITGIAADPPATSHFRYDFLASYKGHPMVGEPDDQDNWLGLGVYTYARLRGAGSDLKLDEFTDRVVAPLAANQAASMADQEFGGYTFKVQPLRSIHLHSHLLDELAPNGSIQDVLIFSAIAVFVLLLACINFVNLSTARAAIRTQEIGIRKVLGSARSDVAKLFFLEAYLIAGAAVVLSVILLGAFSRYSSGVWIAFDVFDPLTISTAAALFVAVGFAAGMYPAVYLSSLDPAAALKSDGGFLRGSRLRSGLVVVQIAVTATLLCCTAVVALQMRFVANKDLGFDRSTVVVLEGTEAVRHRMDALKSGLTSHPAVDHAANSEAVPGHALGRAHVHLQGEADEPIAASAMTVGFGFVETIGMRMVAGRAFSSDVASDSMAVVLNTTAASMLGRSPRQIVGAELMSEGRPYTVIGVVEDYHHTSLRSPIAPTVLFGPDPWNANRPNQVVAVRIRADEMPAAMAHIRSTWTEVAPEEPLQYAFLDARLAAQYEREKKDGWMFSAFSLLAVAIACFGLIGLSSFTTQSRSREIGIRKIHGATMTGISRLFISQFVKLTGLAYVIAVPVGFLVMRAWLSRFAYRIDIDLIPFIAAGLLTLVMVVGATVFQVLRAARMNPIDILRQ